MYSPRSGLPALGLCAFGLCCCCALHAQSQPVADLNPLLSGYELPGMLTPQPTITTLSAEYAVANISLDQHTAQEALQLDAELKRWQFSFNMALNQTLGLNFDLPYVQLSGGHLDSFIESFHGTLGLPNGNRDLWPSDRLRLQHVRNGQQDYAVNSPQRGIGDLTVRLGKQLGTQQRFNNAVWLSLKLPTGSADKLTGSGATDASISFVSAQILSARFTSQQQISISRLGQGRRLIEQQENWVWSGSLGMDAKVTSHWYAAIQLDGHSRVFDSDLRALGNALQLSFGPSYHLDSWTGVLLITEDIAVDTAPDVQLQLRITKKL